MPAVPALRLAPIAPSRRRRPTASTPAERPPRPASRPRRSAATARRKRRRKAPWWELPLLVAVAIVVAVLVKTFVVQPFYIPSESMEKTLHGCAGCSGRPDPGQQADLRPARPAPRRHRRVQRPARLGRRAGPASAGQPGAAGGPLGFGQLVGFVPPDGKVLVKRVIAVGGQTVKGVRRRRQGQVDDQRPRRRAARGARSEPYVYQTVPDPHRARSDRSPCPRAGCG